MGKVKYIIALVWLVNSTLLGFAAGCNRNVRHNVGAPPQSCGLSPCQRGQECFSITGVNIRNNVIDTLTSYLGVRELSGNNDGPEVEMFIASTGLNPKGGYPWCAAFISYTFRANGLEVPKYSARAAAWFDKDHVIPDKEAIEGDLFSLYYRNLGRIGHIGMYLKPYVNDTPYIVTGEGNTNAQGSREGNQAAKRLRPRGVVHNSADWITQNKMPCGT